LLVTAGALLFIAAIELPVAFQRSFEWYLGHSIHDMVGAGENMEENWIALWADRCGAVFDYMILGSAIWAIANLIRRDAVWWNMLTLLVSMGWYILILRISAESFLF
jgi:hypothetical protein